MKTGMNEKLLKNQAWSMKTSNNRARIPLILKEAAQVTKKLNFIMRIQAEKDRKLNMKKFKI
jgi:hypothetical protein